MSAGQGINAAAICLSIVVLVRIGLLPRTFFRPGRRTVAWWLNSAPFWVAGSGLLAVLLGVASPDLELGGAASVGSSLLAAAAAAAALSLMRRTLAAHEQPLALWHQPDDVPSHLVTTGPYAWVRHPFYAAFLLALLGCLLAAPHWSTLAALGFGAHRLNGTAAAEEARFLGSGLGARYAAYARETGRFVPRLGGGTLRRFSPFTRT